MLTLSDLSAMITPVVLILAAGQLILTTSQRLARSVERARKLSEQFEELVKKDQNETSVKRVLLYKLLERSALRSRRLQQVMTLRGTLCFCGNECINWGAGGLWTFGSLGACDTWPIWCRLSFLCYHFTYFRNPYRPRCNRY